jgi:hypothetical protein
MSVNLLGEQPRQLATSINITARLHAAPGAHSTAYRSKEKRSMYIVPALVLRYLIEGSGLRWLPAPDVPRQAHTPTGWQETLQHSAAPCLDRSEARGLGGSPGGCAGPRLGPFCSQTAAVSQEHMAAVCAVRGKASRGRTKQHAVLLLTVVAQRQQVERKGGLGRRCRPVRPDLLCNCKCKGVLCGDGGDRTGTCHL